MLKAVSLVALLLVQMMLPAGAEAEEEFSLTRLSQPIELPAIAEYGGRKKFLTGTIYSKAKAGPAISLIYASGEHGSAILAWYRDMLKQYQWSVVPAMATERSLAAKRGKNMIQIMTSPSSKTGYTTDILIRYKLASDR